ncbi:MULTISPECIES: nitrate reductase subunit alpha [unclassified Streptomyces]|uniref:nitrate reductase subunit alpha n=1 Tax=unclassified Streptomyces TaxID=2593676 RepID=UPI0018F8966C|nr:MULTISPECIES: nitrate reductase subunit alpha [unclassified Streptomyces]
MRAAQYFFPGEQSPDRRVLYREGGRAAEEFYRERWRHDREVRSTHGVNCTGSCSWRVFVKDGIITWETQATDYPSVGPDSPEYEPRGCPRGASFSWYTYSPTRIRYPYVRRPLLQLWRQARARTDDPVEAWRWLTSDPERCAAYKRARGKGGFVRSTWQEVMELIAAAQVDTVERYGPDRIVGFSPIPAMSIASYSAGTRYLSMIGGTISSFYDWYADLPMASPQVFGDQTDVPESADWWNAGYLIVWGTNLPITRTPDAHFMTEARYRGQKVVVVSPDYGDHTKFADDWLAAAPGTDGALAMAMGHVILTEFYRDRQVPRFTEYAKTYTDLPFLVRLRERDGGDGAYVPDKFLTAADLPGAAEEAAEFKTVLLDAATGEPVVPGGSLGFRWTEPEDGPRWNLRLDGVDPLLTLYGRPGGEAVAVDLPRFDAGPEESGGAVRRGVPATRIGGHLVTTVFDLVMAQYAVRREGLPGRWPTGYDDADEPCTPAWQEAVTSVPARAAARVAREFARNAERTGGRSMIAMGAGTNHWFHSDQIYRAFLSLTMLTGSQGVNGGGWAHYVGQEKVRPITGWFHLAFGLDWQRPTRHMVGTPLFWLATDQWRYEAFPADVLASPLGRGRLAGRTLPDLNALAARLGWMPSHPTFDRNPLDICDDAQRAGKDVADHIVDELKAGRLRFAAEDPDDPANFPRVLLIWRANLFASSMKGHEYMLRHLLGTDDATTAPETPPRLRPKDVTWRDPAPVGKLDLSVAVDFRMTSTCLFSDVVLPAATWYEKFDLSSTDMHPFVHAFNPAIAPPWQTRSDFDVFHTLAAEFSRLATGRLGVRRDVIAAPLAHDTPDELAQPHGVVRDWKAGECEPVPGRTMPRLTVVERDYTKVAEKMAAVGPLLDTLGTATKGVSWNPGEEIDDLRARNGVVRGGVADGRPSIARDDQFCEAVLALSGTTNGRLAVESLRALEKRTGLRLADLAEERSGDRITFEDTRTQPRAVITSAEWSGTESGRRRYSPFTVNVERLKPWHTLTGRQHFFLDHDWMAEFGEQLPVYRPPLNMLAHVGDPRRNPAGHPELVVRYLTPHSKWSIHSEYQENLHMLTLFRGGPGIWMSPLDAEKIGVADNDWIEAYNRNGVVACRAVVTHRMPEGTVFMYHTMDRHLNVPRTETSGLHGGGDNSLTRLLIKPTHLIGGYAQFSYAFNYIGPTGNQRDEITVVRRRAQEVDFQ